MVTKAPADTSIEFDERSKISPTSTCFLAEEKVTNTHFCNIRSPIYVLPLPSPSRLYLNMKVTTVSSQLILLKLSERW